MRANTFFFFFFLLLLCLYRRSSFPTRHGGAKLGIMAQRLREILSFVALSLWTMSRLATKALCSQSGRWTGRWQQSERLTGGTASCRRAISARRGVPPRSAPPPREPNPWSHRKQISIFSSERLWISFWCQSWWYRAGMSYIHLIVSFIVVSGVCGGLSTNYLSAV